MQCIRVHVVNGLVTNGLLLVVLGMWCEYVYMPKIWWHRTEVYSGVVGKYQYH